MALQVGLVTSAGSKFFVVDAAALPATYDEAGYEALTYVECGYITEIPEFGSSTTVNTLNILGDRVVKKTKGSIDPGTLNVPMGRVTGDVGQAILNVAKDSDLSYTFKVELNDDFTPTTGHPTTFYFTAKVASYTVNIGNSDSTVMASVNVAIDVVPLDSPAV